jgi:putative Mn2+ efflux pump MntP
MGEESRILTTLGAWMAKKALKTPDNNNEDPHKSSTMYKYSHMMAL